MIHEILAYNTKLFFDDDNHKFFTEKDKNIVSVTSLTSIISGSTNILINWAVKLAKEYLLNSLEKGITRDDIITACQLHLQRKKEAADIGTQIHEWISLWIKSNKKMTIENIEDEKVLNGVMAFLEFQEKNKIKWLESEKIIWSKKYNFAGILDAVGIFNGKKVLFDFKSANGIYPEYALQTSGYQIAYEEMTKNKIDYRIVVRFGKDNGEFEYRELKENKKDKEAFLACVLLYRRLKSL